MVQEIIRGVLWNSPGWGMNYSYTLFKYLPPSLVEKAGRCLRHQGHFLSTHVFPCSSYSCLEIHICWNDPCKDNRSGFVTRNNWFWFTRLSHSLVTTHTKDAKIDPPIQELNRRSAVELFEMTFNLALWNRIENTSKSSTRNIRRTLQETNNTTFTLEKIPSPADNFKKYK